MRHHIPNIAFRLTTAVLTAAMACHAADPVPPTTWVPIGAQAREPQAASVMSWAGRDGSWLAITSARQVVGWGMDNAKVTDVPAWVRELEMAQVALTDYQGAIGLTRDGRLIAWGGEIVPSALLSQRYRAIAVGTGTTALEKSFAAVTPDAPGAAHPIREPLREYGGCAGTASRRAMPGACQRIQSHGWIYGPGSFHHV